MTAEDLALRQARAAGFPDYQLPPHAVRPPTGGEQPTATSSTWFGNTATVGGATELDPNSPEAIRARYSALQAGSRAGAEAVPAPLPITPAHAGVAAEAAAAPTENLRPYFVRQDPRWADALATATLAASQLEHANAHATDLTRLGIPPHQYPQYVEDLKGNYARAEAALRDALVRGGERIPGDRPLILPPQEVRDTGLPQRQVRRTL